MEEVVKAWLSDHKEKVESLPLRLTEFGKDGMKFKVKNEELKLFLPCEDGDEDERCFLAFPCNEDSSGWLIDALIELNSRLENFKPIRDSFSPVLDSILKVFEIFPIPPSSPEGSNSQEPNSQDSNYQESNSPVPVDQELNSQESEYQELNSHVPNSPEKEYHQPNSHAENHHESIGKTQETEHEEKYQELKNHAAESHENKNHEPILYLDQYDEPVSHESTGKWQYGKYPGTECPVSCMGEMAIECGKQCKKAREVWDESKGPGNLAWCTVINQKNEVRMEIDFRGLLCDSRVYVSAIGLPFDGSLLLIEAIFNEGGWVFPATKGTEVLSRVTFHASVIPPKNNYQLDFPSDGKRLGNVMQKLKWQQYGTRVLIPGMIKSFCKQGGETEGNFFVGLLSFICDEMKRISNLCVLCKKELPPLSKLFYCDADLCIYDFEEFGLGFSILQEIQNAKVVEFEIACAKNAASSFDRDAFEPFPEFLLKSAQNRKRPGLSSDFFSDQGLKRINIRNKNLELLYTVIESFPGAQTLKSCNTEAELILTLYKSWIQAAVSSGLPCASCQTDNVWFPYNVLRFILFSNRLILKPLEDEMMLNLPYSNHQFAVIYDSEKEEVFQKLRALNGSVFAFHGSSPCNWYSIIRNGLRCMSNTGSGTYFCSGLDDWVRKDSLMNIGELGECEVVAVYEIFSSVRKLHFQNKLLVPCGQEQLALRYLILLTPDKSDGFESWNRGPFEDVDPVEHYKLTRDLYVQEKITDAMVQREEYLNSLVMSESLRRSDMYRMVM